MSQTCSDLLLVVSQLVLDKTVLALLAKEKHMRSRFLSAFERILSQSDAFTEVLESASACLFNMALSSDEMRSEMNEKQFEKLAVAVLAASDSQAVKTNLENLVIAFSK